MVKVIILFLCLFPKALFAQNDLDILPVSNTVKDTLRQTDLIDVVKNKLHINSQKARAQQEKKIFFSFLPFATAAPTGNGHALITSTTAAIYLGQPGTTNLSSATFTPYWNLKARFGLPLRTSIWLPGNTWNIQGDTRALVYPQYTWGLGGSHYDNERILADYKYIRFYQSALKCILPSLFVGLGYNLDYHFDVETENPNLSLKQFTDYTYGTNSNSFSSGISLNLLYDTRSNSINPLPGTYVKVVYRINPTFLGSNNNWNSIYLDLRKYISLNPTRTNRQNILAFWSYLWSVLNSNAPYLDLPSTGWDPYNRSARGIYQNRYRGKILFYIESEYRRDLTSDGLFGFVVFTNINSVGGPGLLFTTWHPAAGTGLRIKFNKGSNTNIAVDYGFSKGYSTVIFKLGEAF